MNSINRTILALAVFSFYAILFCLWQFHGLQGPRNVLVTALWIVSVIGIIASPLPLTTQKPAAELRRSALEKTVGWASALTIFSALAWVGETPLAATYLVACLLMSSARSYELKKAEKAEQNPPNLIEIEGFGKTTTLRRIETKYERVLKVESSFSRAAVRQTILKRDIEAFIVDECSDLERCHLISLAHEFPAVHFYFAK